MNPLRVRERARLVLALLAVISGIGAFPVPARALSPIPDPATDAWVLISNDRCVETSTPDQVPPCQPTYSSALEACISGSKKFPLVTNVNAFAGGTPPNQSATCIIGFGNPQDGCFATPPQFLGCNQNIGAFESAQTTCPPNSIRNSSTLCRCNDGSKEANGSCTGGSNNGPPCPGCGNPANPANGNKFEQQTVYRGPNGFELNLAFNTFDDYATRFGRRWRDSFDRRVSASGASVFAYRPDGKAFQFNSVGSGWVPDASTNYRLTTLKNPSGTQTGWQLYVPEGDELETYNLAGLLISVRSRVGLTQTVIYSRDL